MVKEDVDAVMERNEISIERSKVGNLPSCNMT